MAAPKWSIRPADLRPVTNPDGTAVLVAPLYDGTKKALTITLTIRADRSIRMDVHGEDGSRLAGFEAWSDI